MAMTPQSGGADGEPWSEINTTPLIDVMLVLLITLIVTIPVATHAVRMDLPAGAQAEPPVPPTIVALAIDETGRILWNGEFLPDRAALDARMARAAQDSVPPEIHVNSAAKAPYGVTAMVLSAAARHGLSRIGLVGLSRFTTL